MAQVKMAQVIIGQVIMTKQKVGKTGTLMLNFPKPQNRTPNP